MDRLILIDNFQDLFIRLQIIRGPHEMGFRTKIFLAVQTLLIPFLMNRRCQHFAPQWESTYYTPFGQFCYFSIYFLIICVQFIVWIFPHLFAIDIVRIYVLIFFQSTVPGMLQTLSTKYIEAPFHKVFWSNKGLTRYIKINRGANNMDFRQASFSYTWIFLVQSFILIQYVIRPTPPYINHITELSTSYLEQSTRVIQSDTVKYAFFPSPVEFYFEQIMY